MANESPAPLRFAEPVPGQASSDEEWLDIESLDLDGQGVAHRADGKVVFVEGALPFEKVRARRVKSKGKWERAILTELRVESSQRVQPACPHFGLHDGACGGCKIQHLDPSAQVAIKQRALEDALWHVGKVRAENILRPIEGPALHYRYRARLSVRHVVKKGAVLIGFHERKSSFVADMQSCVVLPKAVSDLLLPLRELIASMEARDHCPQIELACGEREQDTQLGVIALVLRHLKALDDGDRARLRAFALRHPGVQWWLQSAGPGTVCLMDDVAPGDAALGYALPEFGTHMAFRPTDFTQVNPQINRVLVSRALRLLDVQRHERVIDWFCGLGNFTLPLATRAGEVLGIEGSAALVMRSAENLERNKAFAQTGRSFSATKFVARDLFAMTPEMLIGDSHADAWLIDPPREGAFALVKSLAVLCGVPEDAGQSGQAGAASDASGSVETQAMDAAKSAGWTPPRRIVYVSCNPATLARDAGLLQQAGFRCRAAGVVNMFPHTAHVESIALFERS